jgi:hypothetical protein
MIRPREPGEERREWALWRVRVGSEVEWVV